MSVGTVTLVTAGELGRMPNSRACELIEGVIKRMSPAGWKHGEVSADFVRRLAQHVKDQDLGKTFSTETGFTIARDPDTVRARTRRSSARITFPPRRRRMPSGPARLTWPSR